MAGLTVTESETFGNGGRIEPKAKLSGTVARLFNVLSVKSMGRNGSVEDKVHGIARAEFGDFGYLFADYTQANVELDGIVGPTILYVLPAEGSVSFRYDEARDAPEVQLWFLCPSDFDFDGEENEVLVERMKGAGIRFIHKMNESGLFEYVEKAVYRVAYDAFDVNLTGVCFEFVLKELEGLLLCE